MGELTGQVALVAGGTRGGGRGIAVELGAAGATVYVTGRSSAAGRSGLDRPETIEETVAQDPHFAYSESPAYLGRAVAALAADPNIMDKSGRALATWGLYREYGFTDADGTRPDFAAHWAEALVDKYGPLGDPL